ncbi:hypothetical protein [Streptomyces sp. NPDC056948]|uniref:hypothetical protein n=1 Tax=Streptomyces sp. NPDC056948 TaxID=3345975 RepID=UPI003628A537
MLSESELAPLGAVGVATLAQHLVDDLLVEPDGLRVGGNLVDAAMDGLAGVNGVVGEVDQSGVAFDVRLEAGDRRQCDLAGLGTP